jgi:hypothetical protein
MLGLQHGSKFGGPRPLSMPRAAQQDVRFQMRRLAILSLSAFIAGCAVETWQWYEPLAAGSVEQHQCGGPKEVVKLLLDDSGSTLTLWIEPAYRDKQNGIPKEPTITYSITLGPGSTARIIDPVVVVLSPDNLELFRHRLDRLEGPGFRSIAATSELRHDPRGPNSSNPRLSVLDNHYVGFVRLQQLPALFQVRYPAMEIDGVPRSAPTVAYAVAEGRFLLHRCFTGT